jgi:hypothetical protein
MNVIMWEHCTFDNQILGCVHKILEYLYILNIIIVCMDLCHIYFVIKFKYIGTTDKRNALAVDRQG